MNKLGYTTPILEDESFYSNDAVLLTSPQEKPNVGLGGKWDEYDGEEL